MTSREPAWAKRPDLQWLRALAVVEVVLCHSDLTTKYFSPFILRSGAYIPISGIGVEIFFILSGYLICLRAPHYRSWIKFLSARALRIFPLYIIFTMAALGARLVNPAWVWNGYDLSASTLVSSFLILPQSWFPIVGVGWSLEHEVIFYELTALFMATFGLAARSRVAFGVLLMILGWVGIALGLPPTEGTWYQHPFSVLMIAFALGWLYRCHETCGDTSVLGIVVVCGAVTILLIPFADPVNAEKIVRIGGSAAVSLLFVSRRGSIVSGGWIDRIITPIGMAAYSIYLSHWFVLSSLGKVLAYAAPPAGAAFPIRMAAIGFSIGVGLVVFHVLERPLDRWLRAGEPFRKAFAIRRSASRSLVSLSREETAAP